MQFLDSEAAFGLHLAQLSDTVYSQMSEALKIEGIAAPAKSTGIIQFLYSNGPCGQADIAARLKTSHQLISQRISALNKLGLTELKPDPNDRRRKLIYLTLAGMSEGETLQQFLPKLIKAYRHLYQEVGLNLHSVISQASRSLERRPLCERLSMKPES